MTKIVTHNGNYHTDEVFAVATLLLVYPDAEIVRSRDNVVIGSANIVVDVGGEYDRARMRFDHHQPEGAGRRENGIPYAAFGLVWKEFGERVAGGEESAKIIEEKLVMPIDAIDNGIKISTEVVNGVHEYTIGDILNLYGAKAETSDELDGAFFEALEIAKDILAREIDLTNKKVVDWQIVADIYHHSDDKKIIILPKFLSWKQILIPSEALFVIFQRPDGKWGARAVPKELNSFELKCPFPKNWAGLRDYELAQVSGIADAVFCHSDRFLSVAGSIEGANALARIAVESQKDT